MRPTTYTYISGQNEFSLWETNSSTYDICERYCTLSGQVKFKTINTLRGYCRDMAIDSFNEFIYWIDND